ncbi:unnamed protein product [Rhizoctonia solani]|uniref:Protein kinase domain-containing protein n=1 Tax=Rhizoctonia solani TaxID=456999 RepID=A0A8H3DSY8_9AGAM|nr:unnamed protein product [Rhizoctonia solani]
MAATIVISRAMPTAEVLSHLIERGIPDLTNHINLANTSSYPLFTGGSSDIYYGQQQDGSLITIKVLRLTHGPGLMSEYNTKIVSSIHKWSKCRHPNLHELLGFTLFHDRIGMVSPWMKNGDLLRYLRRAPNANRLDLCVQICEGVSHLHRIGIVHGDIKGALLEVATTEPPFHGLTEFDVMDLVIHHRSIPLRPSVIPLSDGDQLWNLLTECWKYEPEERPSAGYILETVKTVSPDSFELESFSTHPRTISEIHESATPSGLYSVRSYSVGSHPSRSHSSAAERVVVELSYSSPSAASSPLRLPSTTESGFFPRESSSVEFENLPEPPSREDADSPPLVGPSSDEAAIRNGSPGPSEDLGEPQVIRIGSPGPSEDSSEVHSVTLSGYTSSGVAVIIIDIPGSSEDPGEPQVIRIGGTPAPSSDSSEVHSATLIRYTPSVVRIGGARSPSSDSSEVHSVTSSGVAVIRIGSAGPSDDSVPVIHVGSPGPREDPSEVHAVTLSRYMLPRVVISHLAARGCQDLSGNIDESTFGVLPSCYGGSGDVYYGKLVDSTVVCVKVPRFTGDAAEEAKNRVHASREIHTWNKCKHPNILPFLGLAVFRDRIAMVSPWMKNGTMREFLRQNVDVDRCQLSVEICAGVAHLHGINVVHGDLKGDNVLISDDGHALLTDFGSADLENRTIAFTQFIDQCGWTVRWGAPELLQETVLRSTAADVYALGMTILEAITGELPFTNKHEMAVMLAVCLNRELPTRPTAEIPANSEHGDKLWKLLCDCWAPEAKKRPSAARVESVMRTVTKESLIPNGRRVEGTAAAVHTSITTRIRYNPEIQTMLLIPNDMLLPSVVQKQPEQPYVEPLQFQEDPVAQEDQVAKDANKRMGCCIMA